MMLDVGWVLGHESRHKQQHNRDNGGVFWSYLYSILTYHITSNNSFTALHTRLRTFHSGNGYFGRPPLITTTLQSLGDYWKTKIDGGWYVKRIRYVSNTILFYRRY